jgi:DNA-binding transcriptional LysR family regulator
MVQLHQTTLEGRIKVCLSPELNNRKTCSIVMAFMEENPSIKLDITLCDRNVFSLTDGYDLAFRLGDLQDSSLIARSLGGVNYALVASPKYLNTYGVPSSCDDLLKHTYIYVAKNSGLNEKDFPFQKCKQLVVNEFMLAKQFAAQGFGLVRMPLFMCVDELQSGELVVLPVTQCLEVKPLNMIFMKDRYMPSYVRIFVDYVVDVCRSQNPWLVDSSLYLYTGSVSVKKAVEEVVSTV